MMIYSTLCRCDNNGVDGYIYGTIGWWEGIDVVVVFGVGHDDGAGLDGLV
jgi:hypothetical protein